MSLIYLLDTTTLLVLFEFDADIKESRRGSVKWTDKPVEDGSTISDYGYRPPEVFRVEGVITAWPWTGPANPLRVTTADAALRALAAARQPVTLITGWWAADVVIAADGASSGQSDGDLLRFSLECRTFKVPKPAYTSIPASRLKPKVKASSTPKPTQGGAAAGKTKPQEQDWIYKLKGWLT